jgi:hypothetical protein
VAGLARIVDPAAARIVDVGVERPRQALPEIRRREADHPRRPRTSGEQRRLEKALQIDRHVVPRSAQLANGSEERARLRGASLEDQPAVDDRHEIENRPVTGAHEPVEAGGGKRPAQRRRDRNGVHHIAQRAQADNQDSHVVRCQLSAVSVRACEKIDSDVVQTLRSAQTPQA